MMRIGQQVVCVCRAYEGQVDVHGNRFPVYRGVYTVRDFVTDRSNGRTGLHLEEVVNAPLPCYPIGEPGEVAFFTDNFRPCAPTSIESLRSLLAPSPEGVGA